MDLFISDLHLGSPLFKLREEVISLLNEDKYDRIFIIGDIIDEWENDVDTIKVEYSDVIKCINGCVKPVIIIRGNHDPNFFVLRSIFSNKVVYSSYTFMLGNKKVLITHGHEFDYKITKHITLSKFLFPIQWLFERMGWNLNGFLRDLYHSVAEKIDHKHYNDLIMDIEKTAMKKYSEYDIVIMGHTHKEKLVKLPDGRFYINTGSLVHYPVYIEFSDTLFTINKFEGTNYAEHII